MAAGASALLWLAVLWAAMGVAPPLSPPTQAATAAADDSAVPEQPAAGKPAPVAPPSRLRTVAMVGSQADGGGSYDRFGIGMRPAPASINGNGDVAFFATLMRGSAEEGLFLSRNGGVSLVAATGGAVPGGGTIASLTEHPAPSVNGSGTVVFAASLEGGRMTDALFTWNGSALASIAQSGMKAPGTAGGAMFGFGTAFINDAGAVAFLATVRRGRETSDAIFLADGKQLTKLAAAGDAVPGGGNFAGFGGPALNASGMVAFAAVVEQGQAPGGIFTIRDGDIRRVIDVGSAAPGGGIFARLGEHVGLDNTGHVGFLALLSHAGARAGLFIAGDGNITTVATLGMNAPGGGVFASFAEAPALASDGRFVFLASVEGGPGTSGVYAFGPDGLSRLATVGDVLQDGRRIAYFPLNPAVSAAAGGRVTFHAGLQVGDEQSDALVSYGSPPR